MKMISFEATEGQNNKLENIRGRTGRSRSQLMREGLELIVSYYEQNLNAVKDKLTTKNVLSELMKQL